MYNNRSMTTSPDNDSGHIRALDAQKDLPQTADLIDLCFSSQMDPDGLDYIRYIRRVADNPGLVRWVPGAGERVSMPLHGYVWEEDHQIIGNLTIIPFTHQRRWLYLIANVAVHPNFRRRGIGRALTLRALQHIREHRVSEAWLQVRDDNPAAETLYRSLGFVERARRTTWQSAGKFDAQNRQPEEVQIDRRRNGDWEKQAAWLRRLYPPEVSWNLAFDWRRLRPGLIRAVAALINGETFLHYTARFQGNQIGTATWEAGRTLNDIVWLGIDPRCESVAVRALLSHLRSLHLSNRFLTVNYPAGYAQEAFADCGFTPINTLIWMNLPTA